MELILASQSPRRRQLLEERGYEVKVCPADIDESMNADLSVDEALEQLAHRKACAVKDGHEDAVIVAADTIVVFQDEILGKPHDGREACDYLSRLSGETHEVKTGVCILCPEGEFTFTDTTRVHFADLSEQDILDYVATGKPLDKAGAYGIQECGFADDIDGSYTNVVGLPMEKLDNALQILTKTIYK